MTEGFGCERAPRVRIVRAQARDAAEIAAIAKRSLREPWSEQAYANELREGLSRVWIAREESARGAIVGYVLAHRIADEVHVLSVAVDPPWRRRGTARALLAEVLRLEARAGARVAWLEVRVGSAAARTLYEALGFRGTQVRKRYYADGEDALVMTRALQAAEPPAPIRAHAEVVDQRREGHNRRIVLRTPRWPGFAPGQFLMLSPGPLGPVRRLDPLLPRPMAVYRASPVDDGAADVEVLYKLSGRGTTLLADARRGDAVGMVGPLGRGFPAPQHGTRALLVGGGTGIASLYELAARLGASSAPRVLLGARSADEVMGLGDFRGLGVALDVATEDGSLGLRGLVTDLLEPALAETTPRTLYACGPTAMMRRAAELALKAGCPCFVSLENPMACGFGVCLGCAVPRAEGGFGLVCREGPVFAANEIAWEQQE
ncbi:MAG TPA: ribosomal protein S18-alanine N-acetyltransferase [Myxococcota bacterium]|nr:ribosomal protein S18-alanine N-acetyltransferase [Myxococcota bacterium]